MRKLGIGLILVFLLGAIVSCTTFKVTDVQVVKERQEYESLGVFNVTVNVHEFIGSAGGHNLFNASAENMNPEIYDAIQREITKLGGDAAVDVSIEYKATFVDMLLNYVTGFVYAPAHAVITGTVVKY
jgi:hypothetical protein